MDTNAQDSRVLSRSQMMIFHIVTVVIVEMIMVPLDFIFYGHIVKINFIYGAVIPMIVSPIILTTIKKYQQAAAKALDDMHEAQLALVAATLEKEAAEKSNKAKSIFLANMSHELRTPMHGILSFASFGQKQFESATKEGLKSYFDEIHDSGTRLMELLTNLHDLSVLESGEISKSLKEENLVAIIESVCAEVKASAGDKNLSIEVNARTAEIVGQMDGQLMTQVIRHLLINAIKFSDAGERIRIEAETTGNELLCRVYNRGVEIPESELESIFDKFVQSSKTKTGAGGTGLGLAICKEIIRKHGGKIRAESKAGEETVLSFAIPAKKD